MVAAMVQNMRLHMDFKFDIPKGSAFSWKLCYIPRSCTGTCTQYITILDAYSRSGNTTCKYHCSKIPACSTHYAQLVGPLTRAARVSQNNLKNLMERSPNSTTRPSRRNPFFFGIQQVIHGIHGQASILFPSTS